MSKGVCVFDIDHTLTCDQECSVSQVHTINNSIKLCREHGFTIAINTARPMQNDILHGIQKEIRDNFTNDPNSLILSRPLNSNISVEQHKLMNMQHIANTYNIPYGRTILIDDIKDTCDLVQSNGMKTIHVSNQNGITINEYTQLENILEKMK